MGVVGGKEELGVAVDEGDKLVIVDAMDESIVPDGEEMLEKKVVVAKTAEEEAAV